MYCGSSALIGSSVAERMLGALAETEAEASWAAEAEVLELLVLKAGSVLISKPGMCLWRKDQGLEDYSPLAPSLATLPSRLSPPRRLRLSTFKPPLTTFFLPPLPFLTMSTPSSHFCKSQK